jgi:polyisoprenoid-binding protein YceI
MSRRSPDTGKRVPGAELPCPRRIRQDLEVLVSTRTRSVVPVGTWTVDPAHSSVEFAVKHMGIATVRGSFDEFTASIVIGEDWSSSSSEATIKVASIDTNEEGRDAHLRSPDFFDADSFPDITWKGTRVEPIDDESSHCYGELTMHGITHEVKLTVTFQGADTDPWGNERVGLEAVGSIKRSDWDMKFN